MPRSPFRLATLLKLREAVRDERRGQLAEAHQAAHILETEQRRIASELDQIDRLRSRVARPGALDLNALVDAGRHRVEIEAVAAKLRQQTELVSGEIDRRRQAVVEADRELKTIEKLQANARRLDVQQQERLAIRELDDVAIELYRRQRRLER